MKKEKYSSEDVERILREIVEFDRGRMDDAMTERCLAIIDDEIERSSRRYIYKKISQCAAVLTIVMVGISVFKEEATNVVTVVTETTPNIEQSHPIIKQERRVMLSHLDCSMEAGFSPLPQETYTGKDKQVYGVSIYGNFEYTVCTDTM